MTARTEHVRRPESWLSSVPGGKLIQTTEDQWDMLSVFTSEQGNLDMINQTQFSSCKVENYFWRWHKHGLQWQDPGSRGRGSSWLWIMFFQGTSILCKNKNSPILCSGPSKQSQLPLRVPCTQAKSCFLLLLHDMFLCQGCDALVVWLQQCWCWKKKCLARVYQLWKCDDSCYFKWSVFILYLI